MARHSHWAQIKLKKGALDKKRGKIFTKHAHNIEIAVRQAGGDPKMNAGLRIAMENARADNMPRENIDRAIKKGLGELKDGEQMQEVLYEGFGPGGVAILIEALTNNKNRTSQMVRRALEDHGGKLGAMGSISFMFEKKGVLQVSAKGSRDEDELAIIDAGADDILENSMAGEGADAAEDLDASQNSAFTVYAAPDKMPAVRKALEEKGFKISSAEILSIPKNTVAVADPATQQKLAALLDELDENEDVITISENFAPVQP